LVWLLKRFLYRPILDGIDAREAEISRRMQEAGAAKEASEAVRTAYHEKVSALNLAQAEMSETIRKTAEAQRDALMLAARESLAQERLDWWSQLEQDTQNYLERLNGASAGALLSMTRKALADLADETLEERIAGRLAGQIQPLLTPIDGKATAALVTSHGVLSPEGQTSFEAALKAKFPKISVRFEPSETQAAGVVLQIDGTQVSWTVDSYIAELEALVRDRLRQDTDMKVANHVA